MFVNKTLMKSYLPVKTSVRRLTKFLRYEHARKKPLITDKPDYIFVGSSDGFDVNTTKIVHAKFGAFVQQITKPLNFRVKRPDYLDKKLL